MAIPCPKCSREMRLWKTIPSNPRQALFLCPTPNCAYVKYMYIRASEPSKALIHALVACGNCGKVTGRGQERCTCQGRKVIGRHYCGECGACTQAMYEAGVVEDRPDAHKLSCNRYHRELAARNVAAKARENEKAPDTVGGDDDGGALWQRFAEEMAGGAWPEFH